jgi:hypothetical protein
MKVTKWSTFMGDLDVSEQKSDPISGELGAGSIDAGSNPQAPSGAQETKSEAKAQDSKPLESTPAAAPPAMNVESPKLAPETDAAAEAPKEAPKVEAVKADAPRPTGKIMIMSRSHDDGYDHSWNNDTSETPSGQDTQASGVLGKRRVSALAAVVALAAVAGAIGGALATAGYEHFTSSDEIKTASVQNPALEESIMRIDADLAALKKLGAAQSAKVNDRIDRVEKAQAEPAAKLAKLSEAVEKLRVMPPLAPAPAPVASVAAPKETTGSIQPPVPTPAPKPEIARLPTVEGWSLRDVANGGALIEGRQGIFEVYAGDPVPGLGRVDAIRRQDGRWVVVTSKGLIVSR